MNIEGGRNNKACAACKFQRKRCPQDCPLAPYFPGDQPERFKNAHSLFGVSNMMKILNQAAPEDRDDAMKSIIFESDMRTKYPVLGSYGIILHYQGMILKTLQELSLVKTLLAQCMESYRNLLHTIPMQQPPLPSTTDVQVPLNYQSHLSMDQSHLLPTFPMHQPSTAVQFPLNCQQHLSMDQFSVASTSLETHNYHSLPLLSIDQPLVPSTSVGGFPIFNNSTAVLSFDGSSMDHSSIDQLSAASTSFETHNYHPLPLLSMDQPLVPSTSVGGFPIFNNSTAVLSFDGSSMDHYSIDQFSAASTSFETHNYHPLPLLSMDQPLVPSTSVGGFPISDNSTAVPSIDSFDGNSIIENEVLW